MPAKSGYFSIKTGKTISEIKKELAMKSSDVQIALGWLARENKIFFYEKDEKKWVILIYK